MAKRPHHTLSIIESNQIYGRWLAAWEVAWKLGFPIHLRNPAIERLHIHEEDQDTVTFAKADGDLQG